MLRLPPPRCPRRLLTCHRVIGNDHDHGSNHSHEDAPQVHTRNTHIAERVENCATDNRTDDSQEEIPYQSLASSVHELLAM